MRIKFGSGNYHSCWKWISGFRFGRESKEAVGGGEWTTPPHVMIEKCALALGKKKPTDLIMTKNLGVIDASASLRACWGTWCQSAFTSVWSQLVQQASSVPLPRPWQTPRSHIGRGREPRPVHERAGRPVEEGCPSPHVALRRLPTDGPPIAVPLVLLSCLLALPGKERSILDSRSFGGSESSPGRGHVPPPHRLALRQPSLIR